MAAADATDTKDLTDLIGTMIRYRSKKEFLDEKSKSRNLKAGFKSLVRIMLSSDCPLRRTNSGSGQGVSPTVLLLALRKSVTAGLFSCRFQNASVVIDGRGILVPSPDFGKTAAA